LFVIFSSVGAAPVPAAGLVTMITVWQTAFPEYDVPSAISYIQVCLRVVFQDLFYFPHTLLLLLFFILTLIFCQAIDFVVDRLQTCTNVLSDIVIVTILQVRYSCSRNNCNAKNDIDFLVGHD
jgi:Na+/H+-dicarboxylate symporter